MILEVSEILDIGYLGKQRLILNVRADGNLMGYHVYRGDTLFYSFPNLPVQKGDYVVLYVKPGEWSKKQFVDAVCHFLYCGKWIRLWDEESNSFSVEFRR